MLIKVYFLEVVQCIDQAGRAAIFSLTGIEGSDVQKYYILRLILLEPNIVLQLFFILKSIEHYRFYLPALLIFDHGVLPHFMQIKIANISHSNYKYSIICREDDGRLAGNKPFIRCDNKWLFNSSPVCAHQGRNVYGVTLNPYLVCMCKR